jgi:hypothetical protein
MPLGHELSLEWLLLVEYMIDYMLIFQNFLKHKNKIFDFRRKKKGRWCHVQQIYDPNNAFLFACWMRERPTHGFGVAPHFKTQKKKKELQVIDETEMPNRECTKLPTGKSLFFMHSLAVKLNFLYMGKTKRDEQS